MLSGCLLLWLSAIWSVGLNDAEQDEDPRFVCASQNTLQTVAILTKKQKLFMVNFNFYVDRKFAISHN